MSLPVHLVASLAGVTPGDVVAVTGDEAHHAVAVRRLRVGERLQLTDGRGSRAVGVVASTDKRLLEVTIESAEVLVRAEPAVTVVQALPKGDRGELAVEVLTEIGVDTIVPWAASRSVAVWKGERVARSLERWRSTAREAAKQSRRAWFPEVVDLATLPVAVSLVAEVEVLLVLHEEASEALTSVDVSAARSLGVVVGPEGGLTPEEVAAFVAVGGRAVRLGPEVLRTSTAGLAAVAAVLSRTGRWR